jgi:hypothetical protein
MQIDSFGPDSENCGRGKSAQDFTLCAEKNRAYKKGFSELPFEPKKSTARVLKKQKFFSFLFSFCLCFLPPMAALGSTFLQSFRRSLAVQTQGHQHVRLAHGALFFYDDATVGPMLDMGTPAAPSASSHAPLLDAGVQAMLAFTTNTVSPNPHDWHAAAMSVPFAQFAPTYAPLLRMAAQKSALRKPSEGQYSSLSDYTVAALTIPDALLLLKLGGSHFGRIIDGPLHQFDAGHLFGTDPLGSTWDDVANASLARFAAHFTGAGALPALVDLVPGLTDAAPADLAYATLELYIFVAQRMEHLISMYTAKGASSPQAVSKLRAALQHYLAWRYIIAPVLYEGAAAFAAMLLCPAPIIYTGVALETKVSSYYESVTERRKTYDTYDVRMVFADAAMTENITVNSYNAHALAFSLRLLRSVAQYIAPPPHPPVPINPDRWMIVCAMSLLLQRLLFLQFIVPQFLGAKQTLTVCRDVTDFLRLAKHRSAAPELGRDAAQLSALMRAHLGALSQTTSDLFVTQCACPGIAPTVLGNAVPAAIVYAVVPAPKCYDHTLDRKAFLGYVDSRQHRSTAPLANSPRRQCFITHAELGVLGERDGLDNVQVLRVRPFTERRAMTQAAVVPTPILRSLATNTLGDAVVGAAQQRREKRRITGQNARQMFEIMCAHSSVVYVRNDTSGTENVVYDADKRQVASSSLSYSAAAPASYDDTFLPLSAYFDHTNSTPEMEQSIRMLACSTAPFYSSSSGSSSAASPLAHKRAAPADSSASAPKRPCNKKAGPRDGISMSKFLAAYVYYTKFCECLCDYITCSHSASIEIMSSIRQQQHLDNQSDLWIVLRPQSPLVPIITAMRTQRVQARNVCIATSPILHLK